MANATTEVVAAAAKLSPRHALTWRAPGNFETIPTTPAESANTRKSMVAPFPPTPARRLSRLKWEKTTRDITI